MAEQMVSICVSRELAIAIHQALLEHVMSPDQTFAYRSALGAVSAAMETAWRAERYQSRIIP